MSIIKELKNVFVIIYLQSQYQFFDETSVISFDKAVLERKCARMNKAKNKEININAKKQWEANYRKNKAPFQAYNVVFWRVLPLNEAIDEFRDIVVEANVPQNYNSETQS